MRVVINMCYLVSVKKKLEIKTAACIGRENNKRVL